MASAAGVQPCPNTRLRHRYRFNSANLARNSPADHEQLIVRGENKATILAVADPLARAIELKNGLLQAGASPDVILTTNRIVIKAKVTDAVIDYLLTQRIHQPVIENGVVVIAIEKSQQ